MDRKTAYFQETISQYYDAIQRSNTARTYSTAILPRNTPWAIQ
jgi:hypothetical protein